MLKRPHVKRGRLYFGCDKVEKGWFLPFLAAASKFVLILSLAGKILVNVEKKNIEKKKNKKNKKNKILKMPTPDNIIMMKCRTPKKIELWDSRVFFARFKT